ncbi:ribulose-phosphate 3-epimerase-like [Oncorhynchus masou masou]|uniref:ribulose-phosphate 3-epimerase-like n=1 Tax=Oncorhynchus masou masou TaxID=90313 RepID=UPI003183A070
MHVMVSGPERWVKPMAGDNQYTFHPEATTNAGNLIKEIGESGMKVSWLRSQFPSLDIVDGGVGPSANHKCADADADMIMSDCGKQR